MSERDHEHTTDTEDARPTPLDALPPPPPEPAELATWGRRVLATLIDDALIAGVAYLAATGQEGLGPGVLSPAPVWSGDGSGWSSAWVLGTFAVMLLLQAYLGSTPGKLVMGIAVVGEHDGRPVGLPRTAGRWLLHLIDAILLIGYLRPLWHPYRQTYADSLVRTLALRTRAPLPHPRFDRGRVPLPFPDGAPVPDVPRLGPDAVALPRARWSRQPAALLLSTGGPAPRWRRNATAVAAVVCLTGGAFAIGPIQGWSDDPRAWCTVDSPAEAPLRLTDASVGVWPGSWTERRLWVERQRATDQEAGVHVSWGWDGTVTQEPMVLRVTLRGEDGTPERVLDHVSRQGLIESGPGTPVGDHSTEVLLPLSVLEGLGAAWTWEATMLVDGEALPGCGGGAPRLA